MANPQPSAADAVAIESLARTRALEVHLFLLAEQAGLGSAEEAESRHETLVNRARENLLRNVGYADAAHSEMLRALGIEPGGQRDEAADPPPR